MNDIHSFPFDAISDVHDIWEMLYHPFVSIISTESEHNFFDSLRKAQITNIKKFI